MLFVFTIQNDKITKPSRCQDYSTARAAWHICKASVSYRVHTYLIVNKERVNTTYWKSESRKKNALLKFRQLNSAHNISQQGTR